MLDIEPRRIRVETVRAGSTVVELRIFQEYTATLDVRVALARSPASLSVLLGVQLLAKPRVIANVPYPPPSTPPLPPPLTDESGSSEPDEQESTVRGTGDGGTSVVPGEQMLFSGGAIGGFVVIGVACVLALAGIVQALVRRRARENKRRNKARLVVEQALASTESFQFPIHTMRARDFLAMDHLVIFESVRALRKHETIDLVTEARAYFAPDMSSRLIFFSHQVRPSSRAHAPALPVS